MTRIVPGLFLLALLASGSPATASGSDSSALHSAPGATNAAPDAALPERIARIADALDVPQSEVSIWVGDLADGDPILAHHADTLRTPASTLKVLTTFAALQGLGPAYRWRTEAWALGPVENGVLRGDLLLRGYGDPYLVEEQFWKFLKGLRQAGLEKIEGDLVFDSSFFALPEENAGAFDGRPDRVYNVLPHALLVNFNAARFEFSPAADGRSVDVAVTPALAELGVDNRLRIAQRDCSGYQRGVALNVVDGDGERDRVMLEGRFPSACDRYAMTRTVLRPESYAFGLFDVYWRQLGGELGGHWHPGTLPPEFLEVDGNEDERHPALLHAHQSPPLGDVIRLVNKYSNNVMTRHLHLTLGAKRFDAPATPQKGDAAVHEVLERFGIATDGLVIANPSGLTREARISAAQMGRVLVAAWNAPYMPEFVSSLSLVGVDGTARRRLSGDAGAGRMHVKTGTLDEVSAIAGYVHAKSGRRLAVVVMVNGPLAHRGPGHEIQDALLQWARSL